MIANFAEDEKRGFFLRVVGTGLLLFFLLGLVFFVALLGERIGAFAPFFIYGVFSEFFVSAVHVLA